MIDIEALNSRLVEQDDALRATFARLVEESTEDTAGQSLLEMVAEGLAAINERQGNLITLMLRTNQ